MQKLLLARRVWGAGERMCLTKCLGNSVAHVVVEMTRCLLPLMLGIAFFAPSVPAVAAVLAGSEVSNGHC